MNSKATSVFVGRVTRDRKSGTRSAVAFVNVEGKYPKRYELHTKGMNQEEFEVALTGLEAKHAAKEAKLDELQLLVDQDAVVRSGRAEFVVMAAILRDRGTDVELYVQLMRDGEVAGFSRVYQSVAAIPDNEGVLALIQAFVDEAAALEDEHAQFTAGVATLLSARLEEG